jgi:putative glutamine amidotransferase
MTIRNSLRNALASVMAAAIAVCCIAADARPLVVGVAEQWLGGKDGREKSPQAAVREEYVEAIRRGGNIPLVVCRTSETGQLAQAISSLDILILPGGADVEPRRYGAKPAPELGQTQPDRDDFDFALLDAALARKLPVLGICRGMQVINAYFGGTLYQDLPSAFPEKTIRHRVVPVGVRSHSIDIEPNSRLAAATGYTNIVVNSLHHQAVDRLAPGFKVTARAPDGVVEAIEHESLPVAGVQFHPEGLVKYADDEFSTRLFANLPAFIGSVVKTAAP